MERAFAFFRLKAHSSRVKALDDEDLMKEWRYDDDSSKKILDISLFLTHYVLLLVR